MRGVKVKELKRALLMVNPKFTRNEWRNIKRAYSRKGKV